MFLLIKDQSATKIVNLNKHTQEEPTATCV